MNTPLDRLHLLFLGFGRRDEIRTQFFYVGNEFFCWLKCGNKMFRNVNGNVLFYVATYFSSSLFDNKTAEATDINICLLYTSPSPRDSLAARMPSSSLKKK